MSKDNRHSSTRMEASWGRHRQARRARALVEALEQRRLLSTYQFPNQSTPEANGVELQGIINKTIPVSGTSTYLDSGDILQINPSCQFLFTSADGGITSLVLPDRTDFAAGSAPITIETSDIGSLPSGRIGPSNEADLVQFEAGATDIPAISTAASAHDFAFIGLEVLPASATSTVEDLVDLGTGSTIQNTVGSVPTDFTFDRCYIHGLDYIPADSNNYKKGILLDSVYTTIENCYISDIHSSGQDAQAIGGANGLGNYLITNNFLEATGENVLFGGNDEYVYLNGVGQDPANIIISHNYFFKPLTWDQYTTQWDGNHYDVKNLLEFKHATYVTVEDNLFQNSWVGADQVGPAIVIGGKNAYGTNTWTLVHDITVTNNVVENCGEGVQFGAAVGTTDTHYYAEPGYNISIVNNLFEGVSAGLSDGVGIGFIVEPGIAAGWNVTFDHNTIFSSNDFLSMGGSLNTVGAITSGFIFTNNVDFYAEYGVKSSDGQGTTALNDNASGVTITNGGSNYTAAPTVTFSGGGGSGATGTALISTNGAVIYIQIDNNGSGYTGAPTVSFSGGGGSGAAATATETNGIVAGWTFAGNIIMGMPSSDVSFYPNSSTNSYSVTNADAVGFLDTAGDEYGLLSTSPYISAGTGGSTPGVNMSALSGIADFDPVDATLQNYWKFDTSNFSSTTDVDNGLGGTLTKTATLSSSTLWTTSGEMNDAIALTGSSSGSVSVPSFAADSSFTFAAWINPANFNATQYIASTKNSSSVSAFSLSINTNGQLVAAGTTGSIPGSASTALTAGQWALVSVTYSSGTLTLYVDGNEVGNTTSATTTSGSTTLYIGGNDGSVSSFYGTIDDARYYSSALSSSQLSWLYAGFGPIINVINPGGSTPLTTSTTAMTAFALGHADDVVQSGYKIAAPISFSWSEYSGPAGVTFSANNSNAAQDTTVTWPTYGDYVIELTVTDGLGGSTSTLHPMTVSLNAPAAPTITSISPSGANNVLAWTWSAGGGPGATGFDIWRSLDGSDFSSLTTVASTVSSFTDSSGTAGTLYYYEVTAYNTNGPSQDSNVVSIYDGSPAAPTNLAAVGASAAVDLTWTDNSSNETGFQVWRSTDDVSFNLVETTGANTTAWNDSSASAGTVYYYYVDSVDNDGPSNPSNTVSGQVISAPTSVTAIGIASTQASVSWVNTAGSDASFNVEYENVNGGSWSSPISVPAGNTSYVLTGLGADTQYNVQVQAYTSSSSSLWSTPGVARTFSGAGVTAYEGFNYPYVSGSPHDMNGQTGGVGWSSVGWANTGGGASYSVGSGNLTDTNSSDVANYLQTTGNDFYSSSGGGIYRTLSSSISNSSGSIVWASALVEDESTSGNGFVELEGASGDSLAFGSYNAGKFDVVVIGPGSSDNATAIPVEGDTYLLVFEIAYGAGSSGTLSMWIDPDPTLPQSSWGAAQATLSTTASLPSIDKIYLDGSASAAGDSNYWDELRLGSSASAVDPMIVPNAPTNLSATGAANNITLSWTASNSPSKIIQGYDVWRSTSTTSGATWTEVGTGITSTNYTDSGVSGGTPYYYEVTTENSTGDSLNSNVVSAVTIPNVPTGVTAVSSGTALSIAVTWSDSSSGADFNVLRSTNGTSGWTTVATSLTNPSYTDTNVSAGGTYYYEVNAYYPPSGATSAPSSSANAATMTAYEGFAYSTGTGVNWQGATGGLGWNSAWTVSGTSNASIIANLTPYTNGASMLTTSGNAGQLNNDATATRTLGSTVGITSSTLWVSAEMNLYERSTLGTVLESEIDIGTTTGSTANGVRLGATVNGDISASVDIYPYTANLDTGISVANKPYFLVFEIQYLSTGDVISIYEDPTLVTQPSNPTSKMTLPSSQSLGSTTKFELSSTQPYTTSQWDELRLGPTYASVTPDPLITGSGKKSTHGLSPATPSGHRSSPFLASAANNSSDVVTKIANAGAYNFYPNGGVWQFTSSVTDNMLLDSAAGGLKDSWTGVFN